MKNLFFGVLYVLQTVIFEFDTNEFMDIFNTLFVEYEAIKIGY